LSEQTTNPLDVRNAGKPWDQREESRLQNLVVANQPLRLIVRELGRPAEEIRAKVDELGLELDNGAYNPRGLHEK
jgi:hypothetical protein